MKSSRARIESTQTCTREPDKPSVGSADVSVGCNTSLSPADEPPFLHICVVRTVSAYCIHVANLIRRVRTVRALFFDGKNLGARFCRITIRLVAGSRYPSQLLNETRGEIGASAIPVPFLLTI